MAAGVARALGGGIVDGGGCVGREAGRDGAAMAWGR